MNVEIFVQNVERLCKSKGTTPTVASRESGAGQSFMDNVKRGSIPSVAKVQLLAEYLGTTTSELLGESIPSASDFPELVAKFQRLTPEQRVKAIGYMEGMISEEE